MRLRTSFTAALAVLAGAMGTAVQAETIKIAYIDPFSGPIAGVTEQSNRQLKFMVNMANQEGWAGPGNKFEVVDFDGKGSPQESVQQLKNAVDQGIHYVVQALSSAVGLALIDAINRSNERNPGKEIVYFNATNTAPEMTGDKCSFWHFRWDSNVDMKSAGLVSYLAKDTSLKKVYQINQNYATGQMISVAMRNDFKKLRPDLEIVGDDLHQMFQVKDFAPYVSKVRASEAQAVVTGNWGADFTLFVKAAKDAGLKIPIYSFNATSTGIPAAMAAGGVENVLNINYWNPNDDLKTSKPIIEAFKKEYGADFTGLPYYNMIKMFSKAIVDAKTSEPVAVARVLEGMKFASLNGEVEMRKSDHQMLQSLFITQWVKANGKDIFYDMENTGWAFKTIGKVDPSLTALPSTCNMKRPG